MFKLKRMMKRINLKRKLISFAAILIASNSSIFAQTTEVKNIILIIGDGMGLSQVYAAMVANKQALNLEKATFFGFSKTWSASDYTTDSGAGATAISTGQKTYNGAIAVDTNKKPLTTIMEYASHKGLATGAVVTINLANATPAAFFTHNEYRYNYNDITNNYLTAKFDILIGGGAYRFDSLKVSTTLKNRGCQVIYSPDSINLGVKGPILCLADSDDLPRVLDGRGNYLEKSVDIALNKLVQNKKGFFLMIEGSQIDLGGHDQNIDYIVTEVIDLDKAIGKAFSFADKNPGTLVIITADHETGGLALIDGDIKKGESVAAFAAAHHTGVMVPVYTYGTGAQEFSKIMQNTELFEKMMKALKLGN